MFTLLRRIFAIYLGIGLLLGLVAGFSRLFVHVVHGRVHGSTDSFSHF